MRQKQFALIIGLIVILFGPALISSCEHEDHSQEPSDIDYVLIYNDSLGTITPVCPTDTIEVFIDDDVLIYNDTLRTITPVWPSDTSVQSILVRNQNTEE